MASLPTTMKALKIVDNGVAEVRDAPLPEVAADEVLVQVSHVALNPSDWKRLSWDPEDSSCVGCTVGGDLSGRVVKLGSAIPKALSIGDRIAAPLHGGKSEKPGNGAFAEYAAVKAAHALRLPESMSDAEGATLPCGLLTVAQGLYQTLKLPFPTLDAPLLAEKPAVFIYGGSTATGVLGIQFAKFSGYRVLTACSPRNFDKVKALGADEVFDYADAKACSAAVNVATGNKLRLAWDCYTEDGSPQVCADALTTETGVAKYAGLLPFEFPRSKEDVENTLTLGYTFFGEDCKWRNFVMPASKEDYEYGVRFFSEAAEPFILAGKVKAYPRVEEGGLAGITNGLDLLKKKQVSGAKLVYKVADL